MLSPESMKQVFDLAGYTLTGLVGLFSAWQRARALIRSSKGQTAATVHKGKGKVSAMERLQKLEQDLIALRTRQNELQQENENRHGSMLKQQTAMFQLLVEQRTTLDKIFAKTGGRY